MRSLGDHLPIKLDPLLHQHRDQQTLQLLCINAARPVGVRGGKGILGGGLALGELFGLLLVRG